MSSVALVIRLVLDTVKQANCMGGVLAEADCQSVAKASVDIFNSHKTQRRSIVHLGGQCKAKIDDRKKLCDLSCLIQGENWGLYPKNECKISSGLAGMARQLLPEGG